MSIRTESDIIWAANSSRELSTMVVDYLKLYRAYVNGSNVTIPSDNFYITFPKQLQENYLLVDMFWTKHDITEYNTYTPRYSAENDPDFDYFVEGYGGGQVEYDTSTHKVHTESKETLSLRIPMNHLLMSRAKQVEYFTAQAAKIEAECKEAAKNAKIDAINKRIDELNAQKSLL